jgi:MFS family permease
MDEERASTGVVSTEVEASFWRPFRHPVFAVLWVATVISNIGTSMGNAASGWLMTGIAPDPLTVSFVQVALSLPMVLLALPAGALADVLDRRRLLIATELVTTAVAALYAAFVSLGVVTPERVLLFTFLVSSGGVLMMPAWQAIVPQLVPRADLGPAVAANGVGFNISRAVGPALGGAAIGACGIAAPFWLNALSNIAVVAALLWWHPPCKRGPRLPAEHFGHAVVVGVRYGWNCPPLRATVARAAVFFFFGSAYWALLPLVARLQIAGGPELYGVLLGAIGAGAVAGAFLLPRLKGRFGADCTVSVAALGTAIALALFGVARNEITGLTASVIAGASWIAAIASLNVSAQASLPEWVRGRGLAFYMAAVSASMTAGSAVWGAAAGLIGLPMTHLAAAIGVLATLLLSRRWALLSGSGNDLTPSMHWPSPITINDVPRDRGPVMVTVDYKINPRDRENFLSALEALARERRRDGAYAWSVFEDAAVEGRFVEAFYVGSWLEHLRQHERVTNADRILQDAVARFHLEGTPTVSHFVAAEHR